MSHVPLQGGSYLVPTRVFLKSGHSPRIGIPLCSLSFSCFKIIQEKDSPAVIFYQELCPPFIGQHTAFLPPRPKIPPLPPGVVKKGPRADYSPPLGGRRGDEPLLTPGLMLLVGRPPILHQPAELDTLRAKVLQYNRKILIVIKVCIKPCSI